MSEKTTAEPDSTAVRVALWRAMHVQVDAAPHVIEDLIGLQLVAPDENWRQRPDMHPEYTKIFRASIVARARFIEDLVEEQAGGGLAQYVILGAGLDTFAQRKPKMASKLHVFEVDKPSAQAWKRERLAAEGYAIPEWLRLVPVDFEKQGEWWNQLVRSGFDVTKPAIVASTGVSMYLTHEAIEATLRQISTLAPGSTLAMTYLLPMELADPEEKIGREMAEKGARASGTPFLSHFASEQIEALAKQAGFNAARHVTAATLNERYFRGRTDGLHPTKSEELLLATT